MKCTKCGKEMREGTEQIGIQDGIAVYNSFAYCDDCKEKINLDALQKSKQPKKDSALSVWACILSLLGCTSFIAFILALVDLCQNDKQKKHVGSIFALIVCVVYIIIGSQIIKGDRQNNTETNKETESSVTFQNEHQENNSEINEENSSKKNIVSEKEIVFNEIPWGTSFPEVNEKLGNWNLWNLSDEIYMTCSVDEILLGDYKGIDFEYGGINVISNAFNGEQEIAGYITSEITLYFSYLPTGDYLTYDEKDTALYGAQYKFDPVNLQDMYSDLIIKITDIYGDPNKQTQETDLWKNEYTYTYWYGANNTELVLRSLNSENDTTDLYTDEIYLTYAWRGGDDLLQNASDAVKKEKSDKEKEAQGTGNTSGL